MLAAHKSGERRKASDHLDRGKLWQSERAAVLGLQIRGTQVGFVEPCARLLGENALQAFAVKVGPAVMRAIEAVGQILQAQAVDIADTLVDFRIRVLEFERGHGRMDVPALAVAAVAGLRHGKQERVERPNGIARGLCMNEIGRAH